MRRQGIPLTARRVIDLARCASARCPRWSALFCATSRDTTGPTAGFRVFPRVARSRPYCGC